MEGRTESPQHLGPQTLSNTHVRFNKQQYQGPACLFFPPALIHCLLSIRQEAQLHRRPGPGPQRPPDSGPLSKQGQAAHTKGEAPSRETGSGAQNKDGLTKSQHGGLIQPGSQQSLHHTGSMSPGCSCPHSSLGGERRRLRERAQRKKGELSIKPQEPPFIREERLIF